jgi:uncharacterized membrane-anchored protein YjiN (DUF445 family)
MKKGASINYGIEAHNVRANALAVGEKARATVTTNAGQEAALDALADALQRLTVDKAQQESILELIKNMQKGEKPATIFAKILSAIKKVGHVAELVGPLTAVAKAFGLPIP